MDDTNQVKSQNSNVKSDGQNIVQPQQNQPVQSSQSQPVSGGGSKEKFPLPSSGTSEWVTPSTPEMQIPKELEGHIEATPLPTIPQDVGQAGLTHAKEATPVTVVAGEEPLGLNTPPTVLSSIKKAHRSIKESVRWLAELIGLAQKKRDREIDHPGGERTGGDE